MLELQKFPGITTSTFQTATTLLGEFCCTIVTSVRLSTCGILKPLGKW